MLILTPTGQAVNAHYVVRLYVQADRAVAGEDKQADRYHVMAQLSSGNCVVAAASLEEKLAQPLFKEVVRHWIQGRAYCDITALLKRLQSGEAEACGRKAVCL